MGMQKHSQYAVALASIACVEILLSSASVRVNVDMIAILLNVYLRFPIALLSRNRISSYMNVGEGTGVYISLNMAGLGEELMKRRTWPEF